MTQAQYLIDRWEQLRSARRIWDREWQDIRYLVRPFSKDFLRSAVPGEARTLMIFDGTAPTALEQMASGLHSFLTNPVDRWFTLGVVDQQEELDDESLLWLEKASDLIYATYSNDRSCFTQTMHEAYLDLGAFGNTIVHQWWSPQIDGVRFRCIPVSSCCFDENSEGQIDTIFRELKMTARQIEQEFTKDGMLDVELMRKLSVRPGDQHTVIHAVYPRSDRDLTKVDSKNKQFASVWILREQGVVLRESGFDSMPYHVSRWVKMADEVYGRGPGHKCLPDIRSLNVMERTLVKAAQKMVDPPIIVDNDSCLLPLRTAPGSTIFKEPGSDKPEPLLTGANLPIGIDMTNQKREHIKDCFYSSWFRMIKDKIEMTATEVLQRREEMLELLSPMIGRQQSELLGPCVSRTFRLLAEKGMFGPLPKGLQRHEVKIYYISPAAQAQTGMKAVEMSRFVNDLLPLLQADPTILDSVDLHEYVEQLALLRRVSRKIIRPSKEVDDMRANRQAQMQAQAMAQVAEPATKAIKNLADARSAGGGDLMNSIGNVIGMAQ